MKNFSTNQVRHLFVAGAVDANLDTNLDIAFGVTETGDMYFKYKNADGLLTRSDTINVKKVRCVNKVAAADQATKLYAHTVAVDTSAVTLANLVGKNIVCKVTFKGIFDESFSSTLSFNAVVVGDATNTASTTNFHKDLAIAIAKALPTLDKNFPLLKVFSNGTEVTATTAASAVTGSSAGVVLVEAAQKYVRGKLSGEPIHFDVSFKLEDGNLKNIVWGTDTVAPSAISNNIVVPANYRLADMEYFCLGERGDVYRGALWPNDYQPTYAIDPFSDTAYYVLTIEYFWNGDASDVQKSPKTMHIVGSSTVINSLYSSVMAAISAGGSGSGSGA